MLLAACACGAIAGACLAATWLSVREESRRHRSLRAAVDAGGSSYVVPTCGGMAARVLLSVQKQGRTAVPGVLRRFLEGPAMGLGLRDARTLLARAGLLDAVPVGNLRVTRFKAMAAMGSAGAIAGAMFTPELGLAVGIAGAAAGYASVPWALKREAEARNSDMERHLSEMLEVVVLGLRSGLSFERAFALYPQYFESGLGHAMERAVEQWDMGLLTREEALRRLEEGYDSQLLSRAVGSMVRSLRFGTSVAESLESSAVEAREVHRARMEEQVAKVAVKMMLPVGTLILPAMLLLVLGPVLLELMEGF